MANLTEDGNYTTTGLGFSCSPGLGTAQKIFILTINLPSSIFAIIGNLLIIIALRKVSCLHPPSKLLLSCLACTDLCVGLITHPLFCIFLMAPEHSRVCFFSSLLFFYHCFNILWGIFVNNDCNKCGQTSCSVAGTKIQTGCNYEASKGSRWYSLGLMPYHYAGTIS